MIRKIVSGGQTGVDRASLDVARAEGISHGGWCPQGRRAEDGRIDDRYCLSETPSSRYSQRTEWNVRDSDGTLIITRGSASGGTDLTIEMARKYDRPLLVWDLDKSSRTVEEVLGWIEEEEIDTLNVAGPRASEVEGIYDDAVEALRRVLGAGSG